MQQCKSMKYSYLQSTSSYVDPLFHGYCGYISNPAQMAIPHTHDYYEIFFVNNGSAHHIVNNNSLYLERGALVFIRPADEHYYETTEGSNFQFFNIVIPTATIAHIANFLGENFRNYFLGSAMVPIHRTLNINSANRVAKMLEELMMFTKSEIDYYNMEFDIIMIHLIHYFISPSSYESEANFPGWFSHLLTEMQKPHNYSKGIKAMQDISNYSKEYLCRTFKHYMNTTPTSYINRLRMQEAARRLIYTEDSVIDLSLELGFSNLSHFYHLFKKSYSMSPVQYRKLAHNSLLPFISSIEIEE